MPSSNSISTEPGSTHQAYQYENGINESSENQWSPDTTNTQGEATPLQWPAMPLHIVPVNSNGISTPYDTNNVAIPGVNTPIDLDDPHSFSQINRPQNGYSMLNAPRMTYGSSFLMTPSSHNPMLTPRTCMTPVSSTSQFKNRAPSCIVTRHPIPKKPKRNRTAFTSYQMMQLEREYTRSHYLDRSRRIELSKILSLNERTIKIWYQNRRMKEKKEKAESMEDSEETTESSPEHGNIPMQMAVHHDYPTPVADALYKQDVVYFESYPEKSMSQLAAPHAMNNQMMNGYNYEYPQEQHLAFEYRQMQLQNEASAYGNQMQDMHVPPQFHEEPPQAADQGTVNTLLMSDVQNTDISWIRNIYPDEEC